MKVNKEELEKLANKSDADLWLDIQALAKSKGFSLPTAMPKHEDIENAAARELTVCPPPISTSSDITRVAGHLPRGSVYTAAGNDAAGQSWPSARHLPH